MTQKKQTKKLTKKSEHGRSMIEMVGVLAVMGLITAAAFVLITSALRSQKLTRVNDDVAAIAAGVRLVYANKPDFKNVKDADLSLIGYDNVKSPYNNNYTLKAGKDDDHFTISFIADKTSCSALATQLNGANGCTATCTTTTTTVEISCVKYVSDTSTKPEVNSPGLGGGIGGSIGGGSNRT